MSTINFNGAISGNSKISLNEGSTINLKKISIELNGKMIEKNKDVELTILNGVLKITTK